MAYPMTEGNYNLFDMLSMVQKSIRRGDYRNAGFAGYELRKTYRAAMWNRLLVISCEDCFGILTKEILALKQKDEKERDDSNIANALALMCRALKSRDACYFACNFVLCTRNPREIEVDEEEVVRLSKYLDKQKKTEYDDFGFEQMNLFDKPIKKETLETATVGAKLQKAIRHLDMDMIGYEMDILRKGHRDFLWDVFFDYVQENCKSLEYEMAALKTADDVVNKSKKDKDEIFISKAVMLMCYEFDGRFERIEADGLIEADRLINWNRIKVKPICECELGSEGIPDWVYDCHTIKGRQAGKTDWDMTNDEQAALRPLAGTYFDEASWLYTYEDDFQNGRIKGNLMALIREFAETHEANPVEFIPY